MTFDNYKKLLSDDMHIEKCAVCGSDAELCQYSESSDSNVSRVVMCTNSEGIGPQVTDGILNAGCLLYMPPQEFYCATSKQAIKYWNDYCMALIELRKQKNVSTFGDKDFSIEFTVPWNEASEIEGTEEKYKQYWIQHPIVRAQKHFFVNVQEKIDSNWYHSVIEYDEQNVILTKQSTRLDLLTGKNMTNSIEQIESKAHRENEVNQYATFPITYKESERCSYCGSLSPAKLVEAIKQGISVSFADRKYGWPHKLYLNQSYSGSIKFYTVHLRDATEEESEIIANACGLRFKFDTESYGDISWEPVNNSTTE